MVLPHVAKLHIHAPNTQRLTARATLLVDFDLRHVVGVDPLRP